MFKSNLKKQQTCYDCFKTWCDSIEFSHFVIKKFETTREKVINQTKDIQKNPIALKSNLQSIEKNQNFRALGTYLLMLSS